MNGKKQPLASAPSILTFAPGAATVGFVFQEPFGDLGEYAFKVVHAGGRTEGRALVALGVSPRRV